MPPADFRNGAHTSPSSGSPPAGSPNGGGANGSDRLTGWKDIANYLGKGVRTAQRWEQHFGLPVHRIGGEVVFALRSEIDAWSTAKSGQRRPNGALDLPADANGEAEDREDAFPLRLTDRLRALVLKRPHLAALAIAILGVLVTVVAWVIVRGLWTQADTMAPIADVRLAGHRLEALDPGGRALWFYSFAELQTPRNTHPDRPKLLIITDLTGDGRPEVLYVASNDQTGSRLFVFNSEGSVRFERQWTGTVRFGDQDYKGPFQAMWVWVTRPAAGDPVIWLSSRDRVEFPSILERLDTSGAVTGEYWQGGEITALSAGRLGDRDVVLVGGVANEGRGASLAVFDATSFGGAAPGPDEKHTCGSCPPIRPLRFFVFPRDELNRAIHGESDVFSITARANGSLTVAVKHARLHDQQGRLIPANTDYTFDSDFNVQRADYAFVYRIAHDLMQKQGLVDHDFAGHENRLFPILEWQDGRFVERWLENGDRGSGTGDQLGKRLPNPAP